jgi:hypothetical protein
MLDARTLADVVKVEGAGGDEDQGGDAEGGRPEVAQEVRDRHLQIMGGE